MSLKRYRPTMDEEVLRSWAEDAQKEIDQLRNTDNGRAVVLLKATLEILKKCHRSGYVEDVMGQTAFYDGADCDGWCLGNDIAYLLDEDDLDSM